MTYIECSLVHWNRQFDDTTDLKKLEDFIEKLNTEEEEAESVENVNEDANNQDDVMTEETIAPDDNNDNENDNDQDYDMDDTSYVNEDISSQHS